MSIWKVVIDMCILVLYEFWEKYNFIPHILFCIANTVLTLVYMYAVCVQGKVCGQPNLKQDFCQHVSMRNTSSLSHKEIYQKPLLVTHI